MNNIEISIKGNLIKIKEDNLSKYFFKNQIKNISCLDVSDLVKSPYKSGWITQEEYQHTIGDLPSNHITNDHIEQRKKIEFEKILAQKYECEISIYDIFNITITKEEFDFILEWMAK